MKTGYFSFNSRRGTEVVITALTRNQMVRVTWHMGSNPILSATLPPSATQDRQQNRYKQTI